MALLPISEGAAAVLKEVYGDLAKPGVEQVGLALGTVISLVCIPLLPLRLLNEVARQYEIRKFSEIAERFKKIDPSDVIDVRPELGVPIFDALDSTEDATLRELFVELLAKAADKNQVGLVHPSFTYAVRQMVPDEARLLRYWTNGEVYPLLRLRKKLAVGEKTLREAMINLPQDIVYPEMINFYLVNLRAKGLIEFGVEKWMDDDEPFYHDLIKSLKLEFPDATDNSFSLRLNSKGVSSPVGVGEGDILFERGVLEITAFGAAFQRAGIS